jgi:hypothetical protein
MNVDHLPGDLTVPSVPLTALPRPRPCTVSDALWQFDSPVIPVFAAVRILRKVRTVALRGGRISMAKSQENSRDRRDAP